MFIMFINVVYVKSKMHSVAGIWLAKRNVIMKKNKSQFLSKLYYCINVYKYSCSKALVNQNMSCSK